MSITTQVFILSIIVLVGAVCRKLGYFTDEAIHGITQLVVNVAVPCLTISNMQREFSEDVLRNFMLTFTLSMIVIMVSLIIGITLFQKRPHSKRAVLANLAGFSNCGFMGYPIILAINPEWMIYAVAFNIGYLFIAWTVGVGLFCGRENISIKRVLLNPNIISSVIGFVLFCSRIRLPEIPSQVLSLLGNVTTPLSMLIIGTRVCGIRLSDLMDWDYHISAVLRLIGLPLLVLIMLRGFPLPGSVWGTLYILTAMPCATMTGMQAELYGGDATFAARAIAYSTLLSLITVPLMSLLL